MTENELERAKRYGSAFSLVMLSIDDFASIKASYGPRASDKLLQTLAKTVRRQIRPLDLFARFGDAEFVMLQPQSKADDALLAANRIREIIAQTPVLAGSEVLEFTVCVGVTTCNDPKRGLEPLFHRLKEALLDAQELGSDRLVVR